MYGLIIVASDQEDVIKVATSKNKIEEFAEDYMKNYLKKCNLNRRSIEYLQFLDAIKVKEIEAAMELFSTICEKCEMPSMLAIAKVEFLHDA